MTVSAEYVQNLNEATVPVETRYEMPMVFTPLVKKCTVDDLPELYAACSVLPLMMLSPMLVLE
jgi:hypothetical protein